MWLHHCLMVVTRWSTNFGCDRTVMGLIQSPKVLLTLSLQAWEWRVSVALRVTTTCLHQAETNQDSKKCTNLYVVDDWIEEPESRDPLVTADYSDIFRVLAVGHSDAVRLALSQGALFPCALDVVKPDAT